jgi:hypothetical protein
MLKGVLHIHSTYSDGELTLSELRELFVADGCRFACVTDHADWFDHERLNAYRRECDARSDGRFRFIAGLEYGCADRMHVLGYGVTAPIASTDAREVIDHIGVLGGVAVIAHPKETAFAAIEAFDPLPHGIEVWNSKYDGRYAPRPGTFALVGRLRDRCPGLHAFYGLDFHWRRQYRGLLTEIDGDTPDREAVLHALATGAFVGMKQRDVLPSDGVLTRSQAARFERTHRRFARARSSMRLTKRLLDRIGVAVPQPVKSELRRIF